MENRTDWLRPQSWTNDPRILSSVLVVQSLLEISRMNQPIHKRHWTKVDRFLSVNSSHRMKTGFLIWNYHVRLGIVSCENARALSFGPVKNLALTEFTTLWNLENKWAGKVPYIPTSVIVFLSIKTWLVTMPFAQIIP